MSIKPKKNNTETYPSLFVRELFAIFFLALGVFLYLCLFSYNPLDPSLFTLTSVKVVSNWGGIFGSYTADLLFFLLGAGAYFIGFFFFLVSGLLFTGLRHSIKMHEIAVYLVFVVLISVLFQLVIQDMHFGETPIDAGGFLGGLLGRVGIQYLGLPGTYLLVLFGALLTFVWATQITVRQVVQMLSQFFIPLFTKALQWVRIYLARTQKGIVKWFNERKARKAISAPEVKISLTPVASLSNTIKNQPKPTIPLNSTPVNLQPKPTALISGAKEETEPKILDRIDKKRGKNASPQMELEHLSDGYNLPPLNLLDAETQQEIVVDEESLKMQARMLEKKLMDFNVDGRVTEIHPGPVITMYEFEPAPGVKLSRIANLVDDLSLAMGGRSVRIVAPLPNKPAVGIEIPNNVRETVWLKDIIADDKFQKSESKLVFALGKDIEGIPYVSDLSKMPHYLWPVPPVRENRFRLTR